MTTVDLSPITKYFPGLSSEQVRQLGLLPSLYEEWNTKINVISRKDIDNIVTNHILHSLAIAKFISFRDESKIFDIGTGGGFPGIPLAILFPQCRFTLIDSIGKKIRVVTAVAEAIGLKNVTCVHGRAESIKDDKCDFVVSRAAMQTSDLVDIARKLVDTRKQRNSMPNGVIALKGGDLQAELHPFRNLVSVEDLSDIFQEEFFETKKIVYLPL
ncbi:16S rRNA (guanine(527)-N(7))-methyltransferase RsmG [Porphyromonas cangingivalis]|uniref:Ribosomal RNA small subunit methyltransferase G n=1 Tax=Porphyromonas cangingivalis TaxID=36874 RepID=A0A1T4LQM1_PORCN|nr:16S rRNA (guanine(527)-N(7))-methyltransferase RsmG [Porphyromonas cangingivalis]SJZ56744.1 16S rRNA (guanine527-N7)-methyltransferase [Porphyromonas cangingivalis]VEJ02866.1 Ribosomal RNA small subunit methyltransferase G [Porphyromonas cangingivalis]